MNKEDLIKAIRPEEVVRVVQDLVRFPSINPHGIEKDVADYIINYMESKGIATRIQEVFPQRYNVIARLKGKGTAASMVFTGHMDVVPVSEEELKRWNTDPFEPVILDGYMYGRGSADMKGGLGAAMVAMGALAENKVVPNGDIVLVATVDEEDLMRGVKALIQTDIVADVKRMVVCEPTSMELHTVCRGRTWAEVTVKGKTAHASVRGAGINAIDRALILMNRMKTHPIPYEKHVLLGDSFWQVSLINGGIEPAIVPDSCTLTVDARLVPGQMPTDLWNEMRKLIASIQEEIPDFEAEITIIEEREPWEIDKSDSFVKLAAEACQAAGLSAKFGGFGATTDGTFFRRTGMEGIIFGPGQIANNVHKENERLPIEELITAAQIYALMMVNWE